MKMKLLFASFVLSGIFCFAGNERIPAWVKEKVSPEEYKLWKEISDYYLIDFEHEPFLKCRHLIPEHLKQEEAIMDVLQTTVDEIRELKKDKKTYKNHKQARKEGQGTLQLLFTRQIKPFSVVQEGNTKTVRAIGYSSMDGYDAHLEQTIVYDGDKVVSTTLRPVSFSGMVVDYKDSYDGKEERFGNNYYYNGLYGELIYTLPTGEHRSEDVKNINFAVKFE